MTSTEGRALVSEWRQSGLGAAEFCRSRGVPVNRLSYWRRKANVPDFIAVTVDRDAAPGREQDFDGGRIEVMVGDVSVRFPDRPGIAEEIFGALARCLS